MRLITFVAAVVCLASAAQAQTAYRCNHDPVCQARRDGTSVTVRKSNGDKLY